MFTVGKRVSFSVVIALLIGWGVFGLLFLESSKTLFEAQAYELDRPIPLPPGVKLNLQVDKKIYKAGETILIAWRNDSRLPIWLAEHADGCQGSWWLVEALEADGQTWAKVPVTNNTCAVNNFGLVTFPRHSIQSAEWVSVVPTNQVGNIVVPAAGGSYRISAPFLKGKSASVNDWIGNRSQISSSPSFTIQSN